MKGVSVQISVNAHLYNFHNVTKLEIETEGNDPGMTVESIYHNTEFKIAFTDLPNLMLDATITQDDHLHVYFI